MKRVSIAELKDHLSENLRAVERGELVEVTDRGRPIVHIVPIPAKPALRIIEPTRSFSEFRKRRFPPAGWSISSLELLLEERGER